MPYENIKSFDPRTCISGKITRINRITANIFRKYLSPFGVTNSQTTLLFILSKREGLTQKQLSEIAVLEKSSLNRNLKRLIEKQYLTRNEFPIIKITEPGKQFVDKIIPHWQKAMQEIRENLEQDGEKALELIHNKLI